jgi:peptide chain release factor subunit 1
MLLTEDIDRLAAFEPVPFPVLSLYLDARADGTGRDNFDQFLRKAFRDRLRTYRPHSPEHASFSADVERIKRYLANELQSSTNGVVIFACAGADGFFEAYQLDAAIDDHRLYVDDQPHLYPLARLHDQYPRYAAVVADTNFARILVYSTGQVVRQDEIQGVKTKHTKVGGWSQARYQRHVGEYHQQHVKEIADVLDRVVRAEGIEQIIIGGDDVFVSLVRSEFPQHLLEKVLDIIPLDIGAPERSVLAATLDALRQKDAETDAQVVDRLFEAVRGSNLGVLGAEDTLAALQLGQVDELVITARPDILTNVGHLATSTPAMLPRGWRRSKQPPRWPRKLPRPQSRYLRPTRLPTSWSRSRGRPPHTSASSRSPRSWRRSGAWAHFCVSGSDSFHPQERHVEAQQRQLGSLQGRRPRAPRG